MSARALVDAHVRADVTGVMKLIRAIPVFQWLAVSPWLADQLRWQRQAVYDRKYWARKTTCPVEEDPTLCLLARLSPLALLKQHILQVARSEEGLTLRQVNWTREQEYILNQWATAAAAKAPWPIYERAIKRLRFYDTGDGRTFAAELLLRNEEESDEL